jgi:hypothetical protein
MLMPTTSAGAFAGVIDPESAFPLAAFFELLTSTTGLGPRPVMLRACSPSTVAMPPPVSVTETDLPADWTLGSTQNAETTPLELGDWTMTGSLAPVTGEPLYSGEVNVMVPPEVVNPVRHSRIVSPTLQLLAKLPENVWSTSRVWATAIVMAYQVSVSAKALAADWRESPVRGVLAVVIRSAAYRFAVVEEELSHKTPHVPVPGALVNGPKVMVEELLTTLGLALLGVPAP